MNPYLEAALSSLCAGLVTGCGVLSTGTSRDWVGAGIALVAATASALGIAIRNLRKDPPK